MIEYVPTKELKMVTDKKNPLYDPERVDMELPEAFVENIRQLGIQNAIIANTDKEIVEGRQRYKAAIKLGLDEVPVLYTEDHENQVAISNSLNVHRQNDKPSLVARKAVRMLLMDNQSKEDVAVTFGCSVKHVDNYEKFMKLDARVRNAVDKDILSFTDAVKFFDGKSKADQHDLLAQVKEGKKLKEAQPGNGTNGDPTNKPLNAGPNVRRAALTYLASVNKHPKGKTSDKLPENVIKSLQEVDVPDEFFEGMCFALGLTGYKHIKGLTDYLRSVQPKHK